MTEEDGLPYDDRTFDGRSPDLWLSGLQEMDMFNIKHLLITFAYFGIPESMLDVGCGTGIMVKTAMKLGVRSYGIDQLVDENDKTNWPDGFHRVNLVDYWRAPEPVDIVFCIESAEHVHESGHGTLCRTLCDNLKPGPGHYLIFSAARPGQLGWGHLSERPAEYWHREFLAHDMHYDKEATLALGLLNSNTRSPLNYWYDNAICFQR
jgi:SAM-dependent methyltransferase